MSALNSGEPQRQTTPPFGCGAERKLFHIQSASGGAWPCWIDEPGHPAPHVGEKTAGRHGPICVCVCVCVLYGHAPRAVYRSFASFLIFGARGRHVSRPFSPPARHFSLSRCSFAPSVVRSVLWLVPPSLSVIHLLTVAVERIGRSGDGERGRSRVLKLKLIPSRPSAREQQLITFVFV